MNYIAQLLGVGAPTKSMPVVAFKRSDDWCSPSSELYDLPDMSKAYNREKYPPIDGGDEDHYGYEVNEYYLCLDRADDWWTVVVYTDGQWRVRYDPETIDLGELNDWQFDYWSTGTHDVPAELSDLSYE